MRKSPAHSDSRTFRKRGAQAFLFAIALLVVSIPVSAADVEFDFNTYTPIPSPPSIDQVSNSFATLGGGSFVVTAKISGSLQKKFFCHVDGERVEPAGSYPECDEPSTWRLVDHPDIAPNPPTIKKVNLYWYYNGDTATGDSISMTYDAEDDLWRGDVQFPSTMGDAETITYYITAVDHYGNVASWIPDATKAPCIPGTGSWDASLSTPLWESTNCATGIITQYEECGGVQSGFPSNCSTGFTLNDRTDDTCGEPTSQGGGGEVPFNGSQEVLAETDDKLDIHGISAGADSNNLCIRLGTGAAPPISSDSPPIGAYIFFLFNPDIHDPNPGDAHFENAYAISYAPETQASDPTLVRVLWNADCLTDPDTADPLDCKIKSADPGDTDLSMVYSNNAIVISTKRNWSTTWGSVNLIGATSRLTRMFAYTGQINLSGDILFWVVDMTNALGLYNTSNTMTLTHGSSPSPPFNEAAVCKSNGVGTTSVCARSQTKPSGNTCEISFLDSLDRSFIDKYRIYRANADGVITNVNRADYLIAELSKETDGRYVYEDTIAQDELDGRGRNYVITSVNHDESTNADIETGISDGAKTTCTPEDWTPPDAPLITSASTPPGNSGKCKITWTADTEADSSITGFYVLRGDAPLFDIPLGAVAGANHSEYTYSYTDTSSTLSIGAMYTYKVVAEDRGANQLTSATADCVPQDLKAPSKVSSLLVTIQSGVLGVDMDWNDIADADLAGYDVYACKCDQALGADADCITKDGSNGGGGFTKMNPSRLTESEHSDTMSFSAGEGEYCFYVETVDNCAAQGTCPGNNGVPNTSGFPTGGCLNCEGSTYMKALTVGHVDNFCYASFPDAAGMTAESDPMGETCTIKWEKVCTYANPNGMTCPATFDCDPPSPRNIAAYEVVMQQGHGANIPYPNTAEGHQGMVGIVTANMPLELTVSDLDSGTTYCFLPFSINGSGEYPPADSQPNGVCCTPADSTPPAAPSMGFMQINVNDNSCRPSWTPVTDKDTLTYTLYRCEGTMWDCTSETSFTQVVGAENMAPEITSWEDGSVEVDKQQYVYSITAKDASNNESAIVADGNATNRRECDLSILIPPPDQLPDANVALLPDGRGCKFWWTGNSPSDIGSYTVGVGYNIYLCATASASSCSTNPLNTSVIQDQYNNTLDAYEVFDLADDYVGIWHAGITFNDGVIESDIVVSDSTCNVTCGDCPGFTAIELAAPVKEIDWETYDSSADEWKTSAKGGVEIRIVDQSDGTVIARNLTGEDGLATLYVSEDAVTGKTLRMEAYFDTGSMKGLFCDNADYETAGCAIYIKSDIDGDNVVNGVNYSVTTAPRIPKPGGGRKEIGNPVCDGEINFNDFKVLKSSYKTSTGEAKYAAYADFNGDGKVDFNDFKLLKTNYKKKVAGGAELDTSDADYCKP